MAEEHSSNEIEQVPDVHCESPDRRELLDKLGRLAIYTPPAMLGLMLSSRATAESCGPSPLPPCDPVP